MITQKLQLLQGDGIMQPHTSATCVQIEVAALWRLCCDPIRTIGEQAPHTIKYIDI